MGVASHLSHRESTVSRSLSRLIGNPMPLSDEEGIPRISLPRYLTVRDLVWDLTGKLLREEKENGKVKSMASRTIRTPLP